MDAQSIGTFLLQLRKEKHLTQKDIAKLCSISTQAVSKWERGESVPDIELLDRLSMLYSITINEIISGERKATFIDINKRANIITLTVSVVVFMSYLFTFAEVREYQGCCSWRSYFLKGYELVFDGIGGWQIYLTWLVFLILVSQLILNIFIVTKVMQRVSITNYYIIGSSIILIFISLFGIAHELFYIFPQFLILLCATITLVLSIHSGENPQFLNNLKEFSRLRKKSKIPSELMLSENIRGSKLYKMVRIMIIVTSTLFILSFFFFLIGYIIELTSGYQNAERDFIAMSGLVVLVIGVLMLSSYKYIGSVYTSSLLKFDSVLSFGIFIMAFTGFGLSGFIVMVLSIFVPITFVIASYKFKKV